MGQTSSILVRAILHWPSQVSLAAIGAAVTVGMTVGLVCGCYPAWENIAPRSDEALHE